MACVKDPAIHLGDTNSYTKQKKTHINELPKVKSRRHTFCIEIFAVYQIILGTIEASDAVDTEWVYKPYMNTTNKRRFLTID